MNEVTIKHFDLPKLVQAIDLEVRQHLQLGDHPAPYPLHRDAMCMVKKKVFLCASLLHFVDEISSCLNNNENSPEPSVLRRFFEEVTEYRDLLTSTAIINLVDHLEHALTPPKKYEFPQEYASAWPYPSHVRRI